MRSQKTGISVQQNTWDKPFSLWPVTAAAQHQKWCGRYQLLSTRTQKGVGPETRQLGTCDRHILCERREGGSAML